MTSALIRDEYAHLLGMCEGDAFQQEVCAHLARVVLGFQFVTDIPKGDGGIDGYSNLGKHVYLCYGLEHKTHTTDNKRKDAILSKFRKDLRRLFELDLKDQQLVERKNRKLPKILPKGCRIEEITLLVNWFESNEILGPLTTSANEYRAKSTCRFVHPDAPVTIMGPKQLAATYAIDELTLARLRTAMLIETVHVKAAGLVLADYGDFDAKIEMLRQMHPTEVESIDDLAEQLRHGWRVDLAFERHLDGNVPALRRQLDDARLAVMARVRLKRLQAADPYALIGEADQLAKEIFAPHLGKEYGALVPDISFGVVARLMGICPVGWQPPTKAA